MSAEKRITPRLLTQWALLLAAALILSWIESVLPFQIPVPGVKLGLSNIVTVFVLYAYSFPAALAFGVLKALLSSLFLGKLSGLIFSLAGILLSVCGMGLLKKARCFSPLGVSVGGAVLHGAGQIAAACLLITPSLYTLLPAMTVASVICGAITWIPLRILGKYFPFSPGNLKNK